MSVVGNAMAIAILVSSVGIMGICASAQAAKPRTAVVPSQEIEILDPNADPMGKPAVRYEPGAGCSKVEIPPVVLVHRYYYSGDRSFRGPMLPGGPTIVVANHPATGEQQYVSVQMLPGSPIVRYTSSGIEYDYGDDGIKVVFPHCGDPRVAYRNHAPVARQVKTALVGVVEGTDALVKKSGIPEIAKETGKGARNLVGRVMTGAVEIGKTAAAPAIGLTRATPLGSLVADDSEDRARRQRDRQVRQAACEAEDSLADIPTIR